jgi:tellurite resistance protein
MMCFVMRFAYRRWFHYIPYIVSLSIVLLWAEELFARAGGGGNYVGTGSGGGGGGGGGGDGLGALIYLLIRYPQIGVPVLVIVVVYSAIKHIRNPNRTTSNAVKTLENMAAPDPSGIDSIIERDPNLVAEKFIEKARKTEESVQEAWSNGDMSPIRPIVSDGIFRRFEAQLSIMRHQGVQNPVVDHRISEAHIHSVEKDRHFDTIHVAIEASSRDLEVSAQLSIEEARAKAGKAPSETYTEIWSFSRRPGTKTLDNPGAVEGYCPNCGASIQGSQATKCQFCEALINSGDYDWVLAEITQPVEWRPSSVGDVGGLAELVASDPNFNRQSSEDRGSYVFWRWIESLVLGNPSPLSKCASHGFIKEVEEQSKSGPMPLFKTAVGSVDLIFCEPACADERDRIYLKVLWSSARSNKDVPAPAANVLILSRKTGATDPGGLSYARCPICAAPLEENDSPTCDYCDGDLAAGDADWVLENVRRPEEIRTNTPPEMISSEATSRKEGELPMWVTPDMGDKRERTLLLMRMAAVVMADGVVTKQERKLLKTASKRWNVPYESINPILYGQMDPELVTTMRPSNPQGFLSGLISAALIDGKIDSKESKLLMDVAGNLGVSEADTRNLMNTMKKMHKSR